MKRSCFVIMPIGDQQTAGQVTTTVDLRKRYDDLIKEALLQADPELDVARADDVAMPGTITSDILTRLMHSEIVVADLTYPNPNVFYELGLRHACRTGTVLIRDKAGPALPFDLSHQRYIEYENTPSGLKELSQKFKQYFDYLSRNHAQPDNHFLELAKLTRYAYPRYEEPAQEKPEVTAIKAIMRSPELIDLLTREQSGHEVDQKEAHHGARTQPRGRWSFRAGANSLREPFFHAICRGACPSQPGTAASRRSEKSKGKTVSRLTCRCS